MHLSRGSGRFLLFLSLLTQLALAEDLPENGLARRAEVVLEPPVKEGPPAPAPKKPTPGTKDAPVDGQDGKPHSGPMIPHDGPPAGSGAGVPPEVGVSGGVPSVDMSKPPPVTGEHEIVGLEGQEGVRKEDSKSDLDPESNLSKSVTTDPSTKTKEEGDDYDHTEKHKDDQDESRGPPVKLPEDEESEDTGTIDSPSHSFVLSFVMILFSEVGDKTFLIAALMAMKHPRLVVFTAAFCSLVVMSILSAVLGHAVPTLISRKYTSFLAGVLFLVFGLRMIKEGLGMEKGTGGVQEEMKEVEQELQEKEAEIKGRNGGDLRDLEEGGRHRGLGGNSFHRSTSSPSLTDSDDDSFKARRKGKKGSSGSLLDGIQNLAGLVLSPAWVQTFVMTFLGEWGDRSQIATIAMAAGQDYWWVILGTISGHSLCTAGAVMGGRFLAEKISVRNVTLGGACAFLVFGVIYLAESLYL